MNPIAVVVLNWNNPAETIACLNSLAQLRGTRPRILVVDNGSTDDSVPAIRAAFPDVEILETGANLGYAGGNNAGIRQALAAGAEAVCILNNDVIVETDFLAPLWAALQEQPGVGITTPLVGEQADDGRVWALGLAVEWRTGQVRRQHAGEPAAPWRVHAPFEVEIASGTAMLVKREVFERVGLLDESYFLYYEETDWCLRVRQAGYRVVAVPSSVVWHKVSATLGTLSPVVDYYMLRNHLRLIGGHWSGASRWWLLLTTALRGLAAVGRVHCEFTRRATPCQPKRPAPGLARCPASSLGADGSRGGARLSPRHTMNRAAPTDVRPMPPALRSRPG